MVSFNKHPWLPSCSQILNSSMKLLLHDQVCLLHRHSRQYKNAGWYRVLEMIQLMQNCQCHQQTMPNIIVTMPCCLLTMFHCTIEAETISQWLNIWNFRIKYYLSSRKVVIIMYVLYFNILHFFLQNMCNKASLAWFLQSIVLLYSKDKM